MNTLKDDYIIYPKKGKRDKDVPVSGAVFINPAEAKRTIEEVLADGGKRQFLHNSNLVIRSDDQLFFAGPGIGAPAATLILEKLIALGAKRIVLMGWCGGIGSRAKIGDVLVPDCAVSGEGTSRYYNDDSIQYPSRELSENIAVSLARRGITISTGKIWSTDAPYRESKSFLEQLRDNEHVVGVDMEFSALCAVAQCRDLHFTAALIVSDELMGEKWVPGFKDTRFLNSCNIVRKTLIYDKW